MLSNSFYIWMLKYAMPVIAFLIIAAGLSPLLPERSALYEWLLGGAAVGLLLLWRSY